MESRAAVVALEGIESSVAALAVCVRGAAGEVAPTGVDPAGGDPAGGDPAGGDPLRDQADAFLDGLAEAGRAEARLAALKVHLAAGYAAAAEALAAPAKSPQEHTAQEMAVTAEVACVLTVSERSAGALLCEARTLTAGLPLTLAALQAGTISWQHARILCDETANLEPAAAAALEAHFLDPDAVNPARGCPAGELVPGRFRAKARAWRERHHPVSIETRHTKGAADRRLEYVPDRDGMAWLSAYLPADTAAGIWDRATTAARALQGPAESRTLTQLRVDVASEWLLGGVMEGTPSPAAQVLVTVPVFSLLGLTEEPAMLDGYGPIPPSMARRLVADGAASFRRVLTDPRNGAPLEIGRSTYRIPPTLRQWLRLRDGRCPFPGCNNPSLDNDADHLLAWADGGTTGISNLGQPCRRHHRLKHTTAWTPVGATANEPPGWTSPAGRSYRSEHQDWEPPHWPELTGPGDEDQGSEPPDLSDWTDWVESAENPYDAGGLGPPLPVDPFPEWAFFTAA
ncbi:HNH endonuclease signature motif containing protein [Arthrobacter sp. ISL-72]|uniref:HNH endonuclease signature motif containing protein n=1 Tax=Arthrobacter sp. ISL-72 TaxID=2819114 RepID=UPI001BEB225B|nr:HNH endonuclease signature motif containing protein [Arthrobacter sp. ISL-72]MBT2593950.1 DUF222 domain-containing protein [Arthrobacter sp. ISL-72]